MTILWPQGVFTPIFCPDHKMKNQKTLDFSRVLTSYVWWSGLGSNQRPPPCQRETTLWLQPVIVWWKLILLGFWAIPFGFVRNRYDDWGRISSPIRPQVSVGFLTDIESKDPSPINAETGLQLLICWATPYTKSSVRDQALILWCKFYLGALSEMSKIRVSCRTVGNHRFQPRFSYFSVVCEC